MRKPKKFHYIYKTTNLLNGRYYYGMHSTDNLDDGYIGSGTYLRRAIRKYGKENFKREIIEFCKTRKELKSREKDIVNLQEIAKKECMNLKVGGNNWKPISEETCRKISLSKTNPSEETRRKMSESHKGQIPWMKGKTHTIEARIKISEAGLGRKHSEETRRKMSEVRMGKRHSEKTRRKISESNIGNYHTEESKQKMSKAHTGKTLSIEHRDKIRIANKNPSEETRYKQGSGKRGTTLSEETKQKIGKSNSKPKKRIMCPHCNKIGGNSNMKRYHFNNCKKRKL